MLGHRRRRWRNIEPPLWVCATLWVGGWAIMCGGCGVLTGRVSIRIVANYRAAQTAESSRIPPSWCTSSDKGDEMSSLTKTSTGEVRRRRARPPCLEISCCTLWSATWPHLIFKRDDCFCFRADLSFPIFRHFKRELLTNDEKCFYLTICKIHISQM